MRGGVPATAATGAAAEVVVAAMVAAVTVEGLMVTVAVAQTTAENPPGSEALQKATLMAEMGATHKTKEGLSPAPFGKSGQHRCRSG